MYQGNQRTRRNLKGSREIWASPGIRKSSNRSDRFMYHKFLSFVEKYILSPTFTFFLWSQKRQNILHSVFIRTSRFDLKLAVLKYFSILYLKERFRNHFTFIIFLSPCSLLYVFIFAHYYIPGPFDISVGCQTTCFLFICSFMVYI